jgi:ABC-2 type transport system ATP-binding protein
MAEWVIEAAGIVKDFGPRRAVDHADLRIERGEIYGLVGPSGAGKTTLIRIICGLSRPTAGRAAMLGCPIPKERQKIETRIGYMPQERAVYRDLSVGENLRFFGRIYGMDGKAICERTDELLHLMEMNLLRHQRADQLSGGEKQRLSLACTLLHDPELLLLDEPTIGLDPALRIQFWEHFKTLNQHGRTILLTTHYLQEAEHCGRVGMMRGGRFVAEGTPGDLKEQVMAERSTAGEKAPPSMEDVFLHVPKAKEGEWRPR